MRNIVLCLIFSTCCLAQNNSRLGIITEYSDNLTTRNMSGGITLEIFLGEEHNFALNYKFTAGASTDKAFYFHSTLGGSAGGYLLSKIGFLEIKAVNALGLLLCFIPEGITYYPNPDSKLGAGFYINPIGSDYWYKRNNYEKFNVSGEVGGKLLFLNTQKIAVQAHVGIRYLYGKYSNSPIFITGGIGVVFNDF